MGAIQRVEHSFKSEVGARYLPSRPGNRAHQAGDRWKNPRPGASWEEDSPKKA